MTKYGLTQEGADGLRTLGRDLYQSSSDATQAAEKLETVINGLEDFPFKNDIDTEVQMVQKQLKAAEGAVHTLQTRLNALAGNIERVISKL